MDLNVIQGTGSLTYAGGSPEAYNCNPFSVDITVLVDRGIYLLNIPTDNATTTPTLNINSIGAKSILANGSTSSAPVALQVGALKAGYWAFFLWDISQQSGAGAFILM